jgi:Protein of unknown function (DUF3892)
MTAAGHHHIVGIGLSTGERLDMNQAYLLINSGHVLYTRSPSTRKVAGVRTYRCCSLHTLRSSPDAVHDNNLDYLPSCR